MSVSLEARRGKRVGNRPLPMPLAARLAQVVKPKRNPDGSTALFPTADDEVSGMNTYTDDR